MKEWYEKLDAREKRVVIGGAGGLLLLGIYFLMWQPFIHGLHDLRKSTQAKQVELAWMQNAVKEIKQLQATRVVPARVAADQSLLGVIDRSAKARRLGEAVKRVQPDGTSKARVWLEDANFDLVIGWLEELDKRYGVSVEIITFEKQEEEGLVDARINFYSASES